MDLEVNWIEFFIFLFITEQLILFELNLELFTYSEHTYVTGKLNNYCTYCGLDKIVLELRKTKTMSYTHIYKDTFPFQRGCSFSY